MTDSNLATVKNNLSVIMFVVLSEISVHIVHKDLAKRRSLEHLDE